MAEDVGTETIYDKEIAPLMAQIISVCKTHKIPVVAAFELVDQQGGPVSALTSLNTQSAAMKMLHYMMRAGSNIDLFLITIMRDKKLMEGHSSALLHLFTSKEADRAAP